MTALYRAERGVCQACPKRQRCTVDLKNGRSLSRDDYEEVRQRMRQRLDTDKGRVIYGERKCIVEPTIGQLKTVGGIVRLLLRGLLGAKIEWKWATTAHNLMKLSRLVAGGTVKPAWTAA